MTIFTIKTTKGNNQSYTVKLAGSILDGMSEGDIRLKAEQSMIIDLQGKLRKCDGADGIVAKLNDLNHVDANVMDYVKVASESAKLKAIMATGVTMEQIEKALESIA